MHRWLAKAPLRFVLIIPFVLQVSAAVGLTAWLSIRSGQQAVNDVTRQLRSEATARVSYEVRDLLSTTQAINQHSASAIQRENLDLSNIRSVEPLYWDYLHTFPFVRGLGAGNQAGDILALFQRGKPGQTTYFLEYSNAETQYKYLSQQLDKAGQVVQTETIDRLTDAQQRPWYQAAAQAAGPVWTKVYPSVSAVEGHSLAINASQPIYGAEGQLQGVVSVILDLGQISQLLESIEFSPSGQIYILEADGDLIGSSDGKNPVDASGAELRRLPATQSPSPLIRASAEYLQGVLQDDFEAVDRPLQLEFKLDGERQFLQVTPIQSGGQLEWFIVVAAPESDFMGHIYAHTRNTLWLCLGSLAVATGSSMVTARWLGKPLYQLNQAAKSMAQGQWKPEERRAAIAAAQTREISDLAHAFSQMALQLNASFAALQASEAHFRSMADNVPGCIFRYILRSDGTDAIAYTSPGCYDIWELDAQAIEQDVTLIWGMIHAEDAASVRATIAESAQTLQTWHHEWRITIPSGRQKWLRGAGNPTRHPNGDVVWITVMSDISDRKQAEAQMLHNALHDNMTDLPNRSLLTSRLELALERAQRSKTYHFAILFLDLDRFKVINDSLGHLIGDQLLITVAQKLRNIVRPTDVAARLGGDEFVILLEHIADIQTVVQVAERLLAEFEGSIITDGHEVFITTSIGIVWGSAAYTSAADLLRDADIALYRAKGRGRARYEIFDAEMHTQAVKRMTLEHNLREAIDQQAFTIYYQPIVDLSTRQVMGFEALIRWFHPTQGFISPADFIPLAEETGLILPISRWMLRAACEQLATWRRQFPDLDHLKVSVNLSGKDLFQTNLLDMVRQTLWQTQLPAKALTLEITESILIEDIETTTTLLQQLRGDGVRISIDDFGTGYSSLSYLYSLPVDALKIDQSFVSHMELGNKNHKIVQAIVSLSDQLGLAAIAEGIETEQQLQWLKDLRCELGQGYLFARPLDPETATQLLTQGRTLASGAGLDAQHLS
jgi:diguanylate cyclase (GGDEF)-like protein/PAS domain S-box-containing protein